MEEPLLRRRENQTAGGNHSMSAFLSKGGLQTQTNIGHPPPKPGGAGFLAKQSTGVHLSGLSRRARVSALSGCLPGTGAVPWRSSAANFPDSHRRRGKLVRATGVAGTGDVDYPTGEKPTDVG